MPQHSMPTINFTDVIVFWGRVIECIMYTQIRLQVIERLEQGERKANMDLSEQLEITKKERRDLCI